jgi:hypothetical protein
MSVHRKAIQVVRKLQRAGKALPDFGLRLLLFAQRSQHAMRQDQVFDARIAGDLPDDGWRHMETPLDSGGAFRYGIMRDEKVRVGCQFGETSLAVGVPAEDDELAANFQAPRQGRNAAVDNAD